MLAVDQAKKNLATHPLCGDPVCSRPASWATSQPLQEAQYEEPEVHSPFNSMK